MVKTILTTEDAEYTEEAVIFLGDFMKTLAVIPSRYSSSRLLAKPLADICGKTLIQRVWEQTIQAKSFDRVVVATDDERIGDVARKFGAEVIMTDPGCPTGSDRVAAVSHLLKDEYEIVANVQGDMPFIKPSIIDKTVETLQLASLAVDMATLGTFIEDETEYLKPSSVKLVMTVDNRALYFSRSPIPAIRDKDTPLGDDPIAYKHIGLYVFRAEALKKLTTLSPVTMEKRESLEQLRALAHGFNIKVCLVPRGELEPSVEVDTPEDLERAREIAGGEG